MAATPLASSGCTFTIRTADPSHDLLEVRELCRLANRPPWTQSMLAPATGRTCFVAIASVNGQEVVLGLAKTHYYLEADGIAPAGYYLGGVVVRPDCRNRGVAGALIQARLGWIVATTEDDAETVHYFANEHNAASIAAHARYGFREIARAHAFHGTSADAPDDNLILFRRDPSERP